MGCRNSPSSASGSGKSAGGEHQSQGRQTAHQGGRRSSALARAAGTPVNAKLGTHRPSTGTPVPKAEQHSLRNCQQPGASQSSAKNSWQDTPEHAQDHKSSCYGATNQPAALQDVEGTFPGGKGYLLGWPWLHLSQQQRLAGVRQDTGAKQTSRPPRAPDSCGFRWGGREVNRHMSHSLATHPTCRQGPTPRSARLRGPTTAAAVLRSPQNPGTKGETAAVSTTGPAAARGCPLGLEMEPHGWVSPWHGVGWLVLVMGIEASIDLPAPRTQTH